MALETIDSFTQGKTVPRLINASPTSQAKIINGAGGKLFYKTSSDVDTEDTEIAVGASATVEAVNWIISESRSQVLIERPVGSSVQDLTVADDVTISDTLKVKGASTLESTLGVTGVTTPTGGVAAIAGTTFGTWAGNYVPASKSAGTDVAFAEKKLFVSSLFLPANKKVKGIGLLLGTEGGTNKLVAGLFNSKGEPLAKTSETTEGTVAGTKETIQEIDLTAEYEAVGPAVYFIGITGNGTTAKMRTIAIGGKNVLTGEVELAEKNKLAKFTAPTSFTADKGPVAFLY